MSKKKTHKEYVTELSVKNSNVKVIGKYKGANIKIEHQCLIHDVKWDITPIGALNGNGCEECRKERFKKSNTMTINEYIQKVKNINSNIEVLEDYTGTKIPILHKCIIHNFEWKTYPNYILHGHGCPLCGREKIGKALRKSCKQYEEELKVINPNICVLEKYINALTPILHKCLIDGYEWKASPSNLLSGKACPKCSNNITLTHQEYVDKLHKIAPNIIVLEEYKNSTTKIKHKCLIDNYEWNTSPTSIFTGSGCPKCGFIKIGNKLRKSHEEYLNKVLKINPDVEPLDKYVDVNTPIKHRCKIHNYIYKTPPKTVLYGSGGCPICYESIGERKIRQWLEKNNILYEFQYSFDDCRDIRVLFFDFYLPEYNLCIEFDGKQHFEPVDFGNKDKRLAIQNFKNNQRHDKIKNEYCKNNNIGLLRIPYYEKIEDELNNFLFI